MASLVRTVRVRFAAEARGFAKTAAEAKAAMKGLDKDTKSLADKFRAFNLVTGLSAPKLLAIGPAAGLAVSGVANLSAALAPLLGLVVALPAVAGVGAVAMGTLKLATAGFGDAVGKGLLGDVKGFAKDLAKMPPPAREAAKAVVALRPAFDRLRTAVSGQFFAGFGTQVKALASTYLPVLQSGLPKVAASMSLFTKGFGDAAKSGPLLTGVRDVISATAEGLKRASDAAGPLANALGQLFSAGAPLARDMLGSVGRLVEQFSAFVDRLAQAGAFPKILDAALQTAAALGAVLQNVGSIIFSVLSAANTSGGSLLQTLASLTGQLADFLRSAQGSAALSSFFKAVAGVGAALRTSLGAVLPALASAIQAITPTLPALAQSLAQVVVAAAPLLPALGQLAAAVIPLLTQAIVDLTPLIKLAVAGLTGLANLIVKYQGFVMPAVAALAAFALGLKGAFAAVSLVKSAITGITVAWRILSLAFAASPIGLLVLALSALAVGLVIAYQRSATFRAVVAAALNAVRTVAVAVINFFRGLPAFFSSVWATITTAFTTAKLAIANAVLAIGNFFVALPGRILRALAALPGLLLGLLVGGLKALAFAVGFALGSIVRLFLVLPGRIMAGVRALPGLLSALFSRAKSLAINAAVALANGVVNFLRSIPGRARAAVSGLWGAISGAFSSATSRAKSAAVQLVNGFVNFVRSLPGKARSALGSIRSAVTGAFSGAGGWLVSAGADILRGLLNGIRSMAGSVAQQAKDIAGSVVHGFKSALGIGSPSKVMRDQVGRWIPEGIRAGVQRAAPRLNASVRDMMRRLPTTAQVAAFGGRGGAAGAGAGGGVVGVELSTTDPLLQALLSLIDARITKSARSTTVAARAGTGRR